MKVERKEDGVILVPESPFEINALKELKKSSIKKMRFEDEWMQTGKFIITFETEWDR
jgi:hypothetical protein